MEKNIQNLSLHSFSHESELSLENNHNTNLILDYQLNNEKLKNILKQIKDVIK